MSTSWYTIKSGTFEIIDRQGLVAKFFGGFMLCIAGCFLYWLGSAIVEYIRFGTLRDVLAALPGIAVTLFMIALFGNDLLRWLGVTLPALRIAGGLMLFLVSLDMVFARHSGVTATTKEETAEAEERADISIFPLATPLIAGPGAMGATILRMAEAGSDLVLQGLVIVALLVVMGTTLVLLMTAAALSRYLGVTGFNVITRVMGVMLAALAVQFVIDGIVAVAAR